MNGHKDGTFLKTHIGKETMHIVVEQLGMKPLMTGCCALARLGGGASRQP